MNDVPGGLATVKDMLLYYASYAGVNARYGSKVFAWVKAGKLRAVDGEETSSD